MKKIILSLMVVMSLASASIVECEYRLTMGDMTNRTALKALNRGNYVKAAHKFRMARSNYIIGFKHCLGTKYEKQLINKSAATSAMINNPRLNNREALQKFLRNSK